MQKVVAFLEKHVQWVAIGLGAVYLLWMVWSYLLNSPVTVTTADGTKLTPGKVDQKVYTDTATKLETAIKNERASIAITTPDLNNILVAFNQQAQLPALASNVYNSVTVDQQKSGASAADALSTALSRSCLVMAILAALGIAVALLMARHHQRKPKAVDLAAAAAASAHTIPIEPQSA